MYKKFIITFVIVLTAGVLFYAFKRPYPITNYPPEGGVWGGMRAGNQPRQGESIPPDKLFRPAESALVVLIIWILLEIVSNFVQQTPPFF